VIKDDAGEVVELHCSYDPETKSGSAAAQRKVKGTIHWVAADSAVPAEVRLYDRLFTVPEPGSADDFHDVLNPDSLEVVNAMLEPALGNIEAGSSYQFERQGYFATDPVDHKPDEPVFNRVVTLRDSWAKIEKAALAGK
jgi:glutaminyl-tRNA synthetase